MNWPKSAYDMTNSTAQQRANHGWAVILSEEKSTKENYKRLDVARHFAIQMRHHITVPDLDKTDNAIFVTTLLKHLREAKESFRSKVPDIDKVLMDGWTLLCFFMEMSHHVAPRARVEYIPGTDGEILWIRAIQGWTTNHIEPEYMTIQPLHPSITHVWHGTGKQASEEILESEIFANHRQRGAVYASAMDPLVPISDDFIHESGIEPYVYEQATHYIRINRAEAESMGCVFWITPSHSVLCFQDIPMTCIESIRTKEYVVMYDRPPEACDVDQHSYRKVLKKRSKKQSHPKGATPQSSTRSTPRLTPREFANAPVAPNVRTVMVRPGEEMADTDENMTDKDAVSDPEPPPPPSDADTVMLGKYLGAREEWMARQRKKNIATTKSGRIWALLKDDTEDEKTESEHAEDYAASLRAAQQVRQEQQKLKKAKSSASSSLEPKEKASSQNDSVIDLDKEADALPKDKADKDSGMIPVDLEPDPDWEVSSASSCTHSPEDDESEEKSPKKKFESKLTPADLPIPLDDNDDDLADDEKQDDDMDSDDDDDDREARVQVYAGTHGMP